MTLNDKIDDLITELVCEKFNQFWDKLCKEMPDMADDRTRHIHYLEEKIRWLKKHLDPDIWKIFP